MLDPVALPSSCPLASAMVPRGGGLIVGEGPIKMQEANKVIRDQGWSDEQVHVATLGSDECLASGTAQSSNVALLNNAAHQSSVVCEVLKPGGEVVVLAGNDSNEIAQRLQESGFENIRCDKCGTVRAIKPQYKEDVNVSPPATALNAHQLESGLRIVWNYCANKVEEILRQNENNLDSLNIDQLDIQRAEEALNGYNEKRKTGKDLVLNMYVNLLVIKICPPRLFLTFSLPVIVIQFAADSRTLEVPGGLQGPGALSCRLEPRASRGFEREEKSGDAGR